MNHDWLLDTVDNLYAAATGEVRWDSVLGQAADELGCRAATLEIHDVAAKQLAHFESVHIDAANAARYLSEYNYNPRVAFMLRFSRGNVCSDPMLISEREIDHDPFYQELLAPEGLRYFVSAQTPTLGGKFIALVTFQRRARNGFFEPELLGAMRRLQPNISRALTIYWNRLRDDIDPHHFDRSLAALGLTGSERRLAVALTFGEALPRYASRTGRSPNTAHSHYRRIKEKLDCASQVELLARLNAIKIR